ENPGTPADAADARDFVRPARGSAERTWTTRRGPGRSHPPAGESDRGRNTFTTSGARALAAGPGTGGRSAQALEHHRHALAAADAHGLDAEGLVLLAQVVEQGRGDARTGHAERVAQCDRAARDVQLVLVDAQLTLRADDLHGKGLVDLEQVDVGDRHAGVAQHLAHGL